MHRGFRFTLCARLVLRTRRDSHIIYAHNNTIIIILCIVGFNSSNNNTRFVKNQYKLEDCQNLIFLGAEGGGGCIVVDVDAATDRQL